MFWEGECPRYKKRRGENVPDSTEIDIWHFYSCLPITQKKVQKYTFELWFTSYYIQILLTEQNITINYCFKLSTTLEKWK